MKETEIILPNKGRRVDRVVQVSITVIYIASVWFGLSILKFWPSAIGFTVVWLLLMLFWQYPSYQPIEIRFHDTGLVARFRRGEKALDYRDVVKMEWGGDFAGKGIMVGLRNEDVVAINGIDNELLSRILEEVGKARKDLGLGLSQGFRVLSRGEVADDEHKTMRLLLNWRSSFGVEILFWGFRPKGAKK